MLECESMRGIQLDTTPAIDHALVHKEVELGADGAEDSGRANDLMHPLGGESWLLSNS